MKTKMRLSVRILAVLLFMAAAFICTGSGGSGGVNWALQDQKTGFAEAYDGFSLRVLNFMLKEMPGKNLFYSPFSLFCGLSMAYNGARGPTAAGIATALGFSGLDASLLDGKISDMSFSLESGGPSVRILTANSLWMEKGLDIEPDFRKAMEKCFQAAIESVDFSLPATLKKINAWISNRTAGMIPDMLKELPRDARLVLANAVYFKGAWTFQFDKKNTRSEDFTCVDGARKKADMMHLDAEMLYYTNESLQTVKLYYGSNKTASMVIFLPERKTRLADFMPAVTPESLAGWMKGLRPVKGELGLPRFEMELFQEMNSNLTAQGMGAAFTSGADFSGISKQTRLIISKVLHQAGIRVNEEGTEAAAATVIILTRDGASMNRRAPFRMICDRPFFFIIRDEISGAVLFMGVLNRV